MAELSITAASVLPGSTQTLQQATAKVTMEPGVVIYLDANDLDATGVGKASPADANDSGKSEAVGITVNKAYAGQPILYAASDTTFTPGATLVKGTQYVLGATTPGAIAPASDLASGWRKVLIFEAISTTQAVLAVDPTDTIL